MLQIVNLQPGDDLPAIQHLLEGAQAGRVLLVLPKGYAALRDPLTLRLLRRKAAQLAIEPALVTSDSRTRALARAEGIACVRWVAVGRWERWSSGGPSRSGAQRAAAGRIGALRLGGGDVGYRDGVARWGGVLVGLLLFLFLLAFLLAAAAFTIPEARVTLVPVRESVDVSLDLRADPSVEKASLNGGIIPARLVEVEIADTAEAATLSTRDAPDASATGTISLINQTGTQYEVLPGAIVRTSTGTTVRFRTVTTATLAAGVGATAQAEIEALEAGPVGNVAAATINTMETPALRGKIRVINELPTQGGGVKQVGVVTRADMDRLKAQLLQQLQQRAFVELQDDLGSEEFVAPESMTVEIVSEVYDQFLEAEADTLRLTMRIFATATAVDRAQARLLACEALEEKLPETYALDCDSIRFELDEERRLDGRALLMQSRASTELVTELDRGEVRAVVAGLTVPEAERALVEAFPLGARPSISVQPDWIKRWSSLDRVPYLRFRIQVVLLR